MWKFSFPVKIKVKYIFWSLGVQALYLKNICNLFKNTLLWKYASQQLSQHLLLWRQTVFLLFHYFFFLVHQSGSCYMLAWLQWFLLGCLSHHTNWLFTLWNVFLWHVMLLDNILPTINFPSNVELRLLYKWSLGNIISIHCYF